ncbi:MAG: signal peptidase I [bacterium]|nr:signal peptidase I [bacterium]
MEKIWCATQCSLRQPLSAYYNSSVMQPQEDIFQKNSAPATESFGDSGKTSVPPPHEKHSVGESIWDFIKFGVLAVVIVIPIRLYIAQPFVVSGASMVPSFQSGHYLIIDEVSYRFFEEPKRGEVVVFRFPSEPSKFLIKRVAGLPGETITIKGNEITIKNEANPDGFGWEQGATTPVESTGNLSVTLASDEYFVLGDNRGASADSRLWGTLKREFIVGRPIVRLFPLSEVGIFPGEWE